MPLKYEVGDKFPDVSLINDFEESTTIARVAQSQPLILAFYRGPW